MCVRGVWVGGGGLIYFTGRRQNNVTGRERVIPAKTQKYDTQNIQLQHQPTKTSDACRHWVGEVFS